MRLSDPYALFLAEQQKREAIWSVNRAAKKPKTADVESLTTNTPTKRNDSVTTQTPGAKMLAINVATQTLPTLQQSDELSLLKRELQERDKRLFKVSV